MTDAEIRLDLIDRRAGKYQSRAATPMPGISVRQGQAGDISDPLIQRQALCVSFGKSLSLSASFPAEMATEDGVNAAVQALVSALLDPKLYDRVCGALGAAE